jgi:glycerol-3-phosphate acyltransferase PlsY
MPAAFALLDSLDLIRAASWFLAAYALGSFPEAWLVAKLVTGQDLRLLGSGNVGVMNTALSVARWAGLLVFLSEIAKGILAVFIPRSLGAGEVITCLSVVTAVVGARFPIWLGFKGGRGNTVGISAFFMISYPASAIALALWALARLALHSSFKATRLTLFAIPVILWVATRSWWFVLTGVVLSLIYLSAQDIASDDHLIINRRWSSFWAFLTSPARRH